MERFILEVNSYVRVFKCLVMFIFPFVDPDLDVLFARLAAQVGG